MAKKVVKAFTKNYNGEALKAGEKMIAFEYTELDAENCTNTECIKTIRKAGRSFKVIYKAVPEEWEKDGKGAFNLKQNEELGHYDVPNSFSMDGTRDEYEEEFDAVPSVEELIVEKDEFNERLSFFKDTMFHLIEKAPKIGYGVLLAYSGSKGADFAAKLRLKHDAANNVRKVAQEILYNGLANLDIELIQCKKNQYTEVYDKEAHELLDKILRAF